MLCEKCGSIDVARTRSSKVDKVVRWFTGRKRFSCNRCGWSALKAWHQPPTEGVRPTVAKTEKKAVVDDEEFDINEFH